MMVTQADKSQRFRALHEQDEVFVMPNPWDPGSARQLERLGFRALATTSSGFALSIGRADGDVGARRMLAHCRDMAAATTVPVSADLENGYADDPEQVAAFMLEAAHTGIAGASIEDYTGDPASPIYDFNRAVERVQAVVEAVRTLDFPFTVTARAEGVLRGAGTLDDAVKRLQAFETAGADVVYIPGLSTLEEVRMVTGSVVRPVNVLMRPFADVGVAQLGAAGARRISTGGALALAARMTLLQAGRQMCDEDSFDWISSLSQGPDQDSVKTP